MIKAEIAPEIGRVTNQLKAMLRKIRQSTPSPDLTDPTATTLPTKQWVVLIGRLSLEATRAVTAAPNSIVKPLKIKN